jgi:hypothetical protein
VQALFIVISADAAKKMKKREENAAAHWCFKVYSSYSILMDCLAESNN